MAVVGLREEFLSPEGENAVGAAGTKAQWTGPPGLQDAASKQEVGRVL